LNASPAATSKVKIKAALPVEDTCHPFVCDMETKASDTKSQEEQTSADLEKGRSVEKDSKEKMDKEDLEEEDLGLPGVGCRRGCMR
jgi:hypothetical protein